MPEDSRFELIDGELVEKAPPTFDHGLAQAGTVAAVRGARGWRIAIEVDIVLDGRGYRPDIVGWLRDRLPEPPKERPVTVRPDWICEIVSESNRATDTVTKLRRYHQAGVPHYWIVDQVDRTLTVHRHLPEGYLVALRAASGERGRAEPFDAVELSIAVLLGEDPEE